jgi:periplasmic protein TonB
MFHDSLFVHDRFVGGRAWALPASVLFHAGLAGLLVLLPLLATAPLPRFERIAEAFLTVPVPPPPPPPPAARRPGGRSGRIKPVQAAAFEAGRFVAPVTIPDTLLEEPGLGGDAEGIEGGIEGGVSGGVWAGVVGPILEVLTGPAEAPLRAGAEIRPPALLRRVSPEYPEIARQARIEGLVLVEAETDIYGRVRSTRVLRSIPLLDQAALDAVRQWVYEPLVVNGRPRGVVFTVAVAFKLN